MINNLYKFIIYVTNKKAVAQLPTNTTAPIQRKASPLYHGLKVFTMFELLRNELIKDHEIQKQKRRLFIENGFSREKDDNGIRRYSTDTRWKQYQEGTISREKAVEYAIKRMEKNSDKELIKKLDQLLTVAEADDLNYANISVEFVRNSYCGYNPHAEVVANSRRTCGSASGCGYDKESAAVAQALNSNNSILKMLYTLKEEGLKKGLSAKSENTCTGCDNRNVIGYGAGYSVLPYFEGGVGVSCFIEIFKKAGFTCNMNYGKRENTYYFYKGL